MALRVNTNVLSLGAQRSLGRTLDDQAKTLEKLSFGSRIVRSADDAAGLAISDRLRGQIRSMEQAKKNTNDAVSLTQVAEGSLDEISNILIRLRELAVQASSDTIGDHERGLIDLEFQNLKEEVDRISNITDFNGQKLLNGATDSYDFQVGINNTEQDRIVYTSEKINATPDSLGITSLTISDKASAQSSLETLDQASSSVSAQRAELGAIQNRLTSTIRSIENSVENLSAANSRIKDADFALEAANNTKYTILSNAGAAVLNQANTQQAQTVLKLLQF